MKNHTIDASGKKLGRVASEAASILMGKHEADFARNKVLETSVLIKNASKLSITEKKSKEKTYKSYSGYPGGLKIATLEEVKTKKGTGEIVKKAVYGMLPKNKLRSIMIKKLKIED